MSKIWVIIGLDNGCCDHQYWLLVILILRNILHWRCNQKILSSECVCPFQMADICTRNQFWPSGIVVSCVRVCVNPELVHAMTHHPFKLEPSNWDTRCKTRRLRSLFLRGWLTLTSKVQFNWFICSYSFVKVKLLMSRINTKTILTAPNSFGGWAVGSTRLHLWVVLVGTHLQYTYPLVSYTDLGSRWYFGL